MHPGILADAAALPSLAGIQVPVRPGARIVVWNLSPYVCSIRRQSYTSVASVPEALATGPQDYINIWILDSDAKGQDKGQNHKVCKILTVRSFGPLLSVGAWEMDVVGSKPPRWPGAGNEAG